MDEKNPFNLPNLSMMKFSVTINNPSKPITIELFTRSGERVTFFTAIQDETTLKIIVRDRCK